MEGRKKPVAPNNCVPEGRSCSEWNGYLSITIEILTKVPGVCAIKDCPARTDTNRSIGTEPLEGRCVQMFASWFMVKGGLCCFVKMVIMSEYIFCADAENPCTICF